MDIYLISIGVNLVVSIYILFRVNHSINLSLNDRDKELDEAYSLIQRLKNKNSNLELDKEIIECRCSDLKSKLKIVSNDLQNEVIYFKNKYKEQKTLAEKYFRPRDSKGRYVKK